MSREEKVESFRKGLEVIRSFDGQRSQTISDVAARTNMSRAAARRFLLTLTEMGLARTDSKNFELTPAILSLGQTFLSGLSHLDLVRDVLIDLSRETGESASAAMLDGNEIVYVARAPATHRIISVALSVGTRLPAHATSMGQVLLAGLHTRELDRYFAAAELTPFTPRTLTSEKELRTRLETIRHEQHAIVTDELEMGLRSIAVPVGRAGVERPLAINISAQALRISADEMRTRFLPVLRRKVAEIELAAGR